MYVYIIIHQYLSRTETYLLGMGLSPLQPHQARHQGQAPQQHFPHAGGKAALHQLDDGLHLAVLFQQVPAHGGPLDQACTPHRTAAAPHTRAMT